jgi:hypothetical protein
MKQKNRSKLFVLIAAFVALVIILAPAKALADTSFTYADLLIAYDKSKKLCDVRGDESVFCPRADTYLVYLTQAGDKATDAEKQAYVDGLPDKWRIENYQKASLEYEKEIQAGNIDSNSANSSKLNSNGDCPDGSVQVSISPTPNNADNCVGGKNPIYTYLSGIIIFMGGAIGLAVVITIIVSGIQYSASAGNAANITQAKERLINAVIGLVLYLFLAAILRYLVPQLFT